MNWFRKIVGNTVGSLSEEHEAIRERIAQLRETIKESSEQRSAAIAVLSGELSALNGLLSKVA